MSPRISDWKVTNFPSFQGMKAYILPGAFFGSVVALFAKAGFERADSVEDADVVVFIGGVDVDPRMYGQQIIMETQMPSVARDNLECLVYLQAQAKGIPCIGICRGAQFLHVVNGGSLWQDVDGHGGPDHFIVDQEDMVRVKATSLHHQMLQYKDGMEVVATSESSICTYMKDDTTIVEGQQWLRAEDEIEAGAYWDTKCFFVQGHPEVGSAHYQSWFMHKVHDYIGAFMECDLVTDDVDDDQEPPMAANVMG